MQSEPEYFVQTKNGKLYAYWRRDVLLCDLDLRHDKASVKILQKNPVSLTLTYSPISEYALREVCDHDNLPEGEDVASCICGKCGDHSTIMRCEVCDEDFGTSCCGAPARF